MVFEYLDISSCHF